MNTTPTIEVTEEIAEASFATPEGIIALYVEDGTATVIDISLIDTARKFWAGTVVRGWVDEDGTTFVVCDGE